ncbi:MAG: rod shape-determining protein RodA [Crocinitomicaceae bacterium]|nr:rod shape-determining protein RodA [Crocinitomicaceae bacterium]
MRRTSEDNVWLNVDWVVLLIYFLLVSLGISNIYSAGYDTEQQGLFDFSAEHGKQIMWIGVSLFLGMIIFFLDFAFIRKYAFWFYGFTLVMLLAVLFMPAVNGAHSWFGFGSFKIQPSEFAKVGVSLALARFIGDVGKSQFEGRRKGVVNMGVANLWGLIPLIKKNIEIVLIIGIPCILVLLQPDAGTFIIFTSFILVLYREGYTGNFLLFVLIAVVIAVITLLVADSSFIMPFLKIKLSGKTGIVISLMILSLIFYLLIRNFVLKRNRGPLYRALIGSLVIAVVFVNCIEWGYENILQEHQKTRIDLLLGKIDDPDGDGYNINRAKSAIGSGGFLGKGFQQATLANANQGHVPMQSTDFIFCTWSEERGFIGSAGFVILFTILLLRIVIIAERQRSEFTRVFAYCVGCIFFYHFMINVGMAIGLAPVIGIPLPFFSYGGSSVMAFSIFLFLLLKFDAERKVVLQ